MRRSQAPSIRRAAKMGAAIELNAKNDNNAAAPLEMQWGTAGDYKGFRPRKYNEGENPLADKRIFLVLWRKQSNKKHKTWTGNGTLEVTATKATLKDETGKVMDVLTCFKHEKIQEDALLEIGMRDVEIQVELTTAAECIAQRKEEIENWYRQQEESVGLVSGHQETSGIPQRPPNLLKRPKRLPECKFLNESSSCVIPAAAPFKLDEYICMLEPAELQYQTMQLLADYCRDSGMQQTSASADFLQVAEQICDHPVLLKHIENQPVVSDALVPHLPPWQEMGVYDSAKFEFVHLMLDNLVAGCGEKCAIVANSQNCLDIIRGYCQCWDIPHTQVVDGLHANCFNAPSTEDAKAPMVALLMASQLPKERLTGCKYVILYNYSARAAARHLLAANMRIYTLITADCLEERQFEQHLGLVNSTDSLMDLISPRMEDTQQLLRVLQNTLTSWSQWQRPFSEAFLKDTFFSDELSSLRCVFSKLHKDPELQVL
ncbi:uncharacterized protein [Drosophila virilis]|uniref:Uncharacterized protein, isoform A n=1 Tax=Drosophila virilis TaxID=7244 RepID=B4LXC0_DROVI|nr:uncharacterized protein LOC6630810 isoform X1 [Drosophila virilis]EDW67798.2 uncharacterized protein Dvir_GJ22890, isoform A [Drosophila virilis]